MKCRSAILEKLGLGNMTFPKACVTFRRYGRFNKNMIQLAYSIMSYLHPSLVQSSSRRSIVLYGFWENSFGNIIDYDQLE